MSESFTRPENFAAIGPNFTAAMGVISFSDVASRLSHPGMHALRISGSFIALQTGFWGAKIRRSPAISIFEFPVSQTRRGLQDRATARQKVPRVPSSPRHMRTFRYDSPRGYDAGGNCRRIFRLRWGDGKITPTETARPSSA